MDAEGKAPAPTPSKHLSLRKQLAIYEHYLTTEDFAATAAYYSIQVQAVERIAELVPHKYVPLCDLRRARAIARCDELATRACRRIEQRLRDDALTNDQLIELLDSVGNHMNGLLSIKSTSPHVGDVHFHLTADQMLQIQRDAESKTAAATVGGNGNRLPRL